MISVKIVSGMQLSYYYSLEEPFYMLLTGSLTNLWNMMKNVFVYTAKSGVESNIKKSL